MDWKDRLGSGLQTHTVGTFDPGCNPVQLGQFDRTELYDKLRLDTSEAQHLVLHHATTRLQIYERIKQRRRIRSYDHIVYPALQKLVPAHPASVILVAKTQGQRAIKNCLCL